MSNEKPIIPELHQKMNDVMSQLNEIFHPNGIALLVFKNNPAEPMNHTANYISNCSREDMICAMKEFIARNENRIIETETVQ